MTPPRPDVEHVGWIAWHPRVGFWCTVAERANDLEPLSAGWEWVPVYARRPG